MTFIDRFNGPWQVANPAVIFMDEPTSGTPCIVECFASCLACLLQLPAWLASHGKVS